MREDQIATAALNIKTEPDAAQRNCGAFDMPTRPARSERGGPTRFTRPLSPPQQRIQWLGFAGSLRVSSAFGEEPSHRVMVVVGFIAELICGIGAEVNIGVIGVLDDIGRTGSEKLFDHLDHLVDCLGSSDVILRRMHSQCGHIVAEQLGLRCAQFTPVDPVAGGPFEEWIIDVGDVLDVVHPVAVVQPDPVDEIECQIGGSVTQMGRVVGRDSADVHRRGVPRCGGPHLSIGGVV